MSIIGFPLGTQRPPRVEGVYIADTFRGQLRVRSWPRKRGKNQQPHMVESWEWLRQMMVAYKLSAGRVIEQAKEHGDLTRSRPQDWWTHYTSGRAWLIVENTGLKVYPMNFVALLCHALDTTAFADAAMLVRAPDGWRPLPGTNTGAVLTMGATLPMWSDGTEVDMTQPTTPPAGAVSDALDALSQTPGAILFRDTEYWTEILPGTPGQVLKIDANGRPAWAAP